MPHPQLPLLFHHLLNTFIKSKNFVYTMEEKKKKDKNNVQLKELFHGLSIKESKEESHRISSTRLENLR